MTFIKELQPLAISADGRWIAFTIEDRRLRHAAQSKHTQFEGCRVVLVEVSSGRLTELVPPGTSAWMPSWSPDGKRLAFFADEGNGAQLWIWSADAPLKNVTRRPLDVTPWAEIRWILHGSAVVVPTSSIDTPVQHATMPRGDNDGSGKPTVQIRVSPRHAADSDSGPANTQDQVQPRLLRIDIDTGNTAELAPVSSGVAAVAPDGTGLVHAVYRADTRRHDRAQYQNYWDLWFIGLDGRPSFRVAESVPLAFPLSARVSWSPDGRYIAYRTLGLPQEQKIAIVPVVSRSETKPSSSGECPAGSIAHEAPQWTEDSTRVTFPDGDSVRECRVHDSGSRTLASISGVRINHIVGRTGDRLWSPAGKTALWVIATSITGARDGVYEIDTRSGTTTAVLEQERVIGGAAVLQVCGTDTRNLVVFTSESATEPPDLWSLRTDSTLKRLTTLNPALSETEMGQHEVLEWTNSNGKKSLALMLLPAGYTPGRKYPVIVWVYASAQPNFANIFGLSGNQFYNLQMFATRGYAVLYPDVTWKPGTVMRSVADQVLPALDQVINAGIADGDRIGVIGHSSGGYDVLALLVQTDRFRAASVSNGVGIYDLASTFAGDMDSGQTSDWVIKQMQVGAAPWNAPQAYIENSASYHLNHIATPLLMLEGLSDAGWNNVAQSEYLFSALNWMGKRVEYRRYPGEEHAPDWWSPANKRDAETRMLDWFSEYLGGVGAVSDQPQREKAH
jgi:dipeptidyl aminopeptidase/acylaminoacyl peptidase